MFDSIPYSEHNIASDSTEKVYLYGLSYCEHCEQGRKLLDELSIPFRMTHLDILEPTVRRPVLKAFRDAYGEHVPYPVLEIDGEYLFGYDRDVWTGKLHRG